MFVKLVFCVFYFTHCGISFFSTKMSDAEENYDIVNEAGDVLQNDGEPLVEDHELTGNESGKFLFQKFYQFIIV